MKKLILSSTIFEGEASIVYDTDNRLAHIDMLNTDMKDDHRHYLKSAVPTIYQNLEDFTQQLKAKTLTIVEANFEISFEDFWNSYRHKVNRKRVEIQWNKLNLTDKVKAYTSITAYEGHLKRNTWKSKQDPDSYLKNRSFDNNWNQL